MSRLINPIIRKPTQGATSPLKKRLSRAPRGQGMVEFALVLPLLLLLLFGIIELGRLMVIYTSVATASRDAARYASATGRSANGMPYYADIEGIRDAAQRFGILLAIPRNNINVNWDSGPGTTACPNDNQLCELVNGTPATGCPNGSVICTRTITLGDRVVVVVSADYDPLLGLTPLRPITIESTTSRTIVKDVPVEAAYTGGGGGGGGGTDYPPTIQIIDPDNNSLFEQGDTIPFTGVASDTEDGDLTGQIQWSSSRDGAFGVTGGSNPFSGLTPGEHLITASVTDSNSATSSDSITVFVNAPPVVAILSPTIFTFYEGVTIQFEGTAQDELGDLSSSLMWYEGLGCTGTSIAGPTSAFTANSPAAPLSVGPHTITACATDTAGLTGSASISLTILQNNPPQVWILAPLSGTAFRVGSEVTFIGRALDDVNGDVSADLTWSSSRGGGIGSGAVIRLNDLLEGSHTITAQVADPLFPARPPGIASIVINITAAGAPRVDIEMPFDGTTFNFGETITFIGSATDGYGNGSDLDRFIIWRSSEVGRIPSSTFIGETFQISDLPVGTHVITAEVTDPNDDLHLTGMDSIVITVIAHNDPPVVTILQPAADGFAVRRGVSINFVGAVNDPQEPLLSGLLGWESSINGFLATGESINRTLSLGTHTITARVTDAGGLEGSATRQVRVFECPSPGSATFTYPNNLPAKLSWLLTVPPDTSTYDYVLNQLRLELTNTAARLAPDTPTAPITVQGQGVSTGITRSSDGLTVDVVGNPIWHGVASASNTIEIIFNFQPNPRLFADGPFTVMATFADCPTIQAVARP